ncbi:unnamed protein product [Urochloa humidicola]
MGGSITALSSPSINLYKSAAEFKTHTSFQFGSSWDRTSAPRTEKWIEHGNQTEPKPASSEQRFHEVIKQLHKKARNRICSLILQHQELGLNQL